MNISKVRSGVHGALTIDVVPFYCTAGYHCRMMDDCTLAAFGGRANII